MRRLLWWGRPVESASQRQLSDLVWCLYTGSSIICQMHSYLLTLYRGTRPAPLLCDNCRIITRHQAAAAPILLPCGDALSPDAR